MKRTCRWPLVLAQEVQEELDKPAGTSVAPPCATCPASCLGLGHENSVERNVWLKAESRPPIVVEGAIRSPGQFDVKSLPSEQTGDGPCGSSLYLRGG